MEGELQDKLSKKDAEIEFLKNKLNEFGLKVPTPKEIEVAVEKVVKKSLVEQKKTQKKEIV